MKRLPVPLLKKNDDVLLLKKMSGMLDDELILECASELTSLATDFPFAASNTRSTSPSFIGRSLRSGRLLVSSISFF